MTRPPADDGRFIRVALPAEPVKPGSDPDDPRAHVALVVLDRPGQLNALSADLMAELAGALAALDDDPACRCIVITGAGDRAFAAGADIRELVDETTATLEAGRAFDAWDVVGRIRTPTIAAVRGYALGGGCELAMSCDMIVAGDDAEFGQPEVRIGVMPGAGGTQRLTRAIGKAKAMELLLTGRSIGAREADTLGLVTTVVPAEATVTAALELAARVAAGPPLAIRAIAAAVDRVAEIPLREGLRAERASFFGLFGSADQREGMHAFIDRRRPRWSGQ